MFTRNGLKILVLLMTMGIINARGADPLQEISKKEDLFFQKSAAYLKSQKKHQKKQKRRSRNLKGVSLQKKEKQFVQKKASPKKVKELTVKPIKIASQREVSEKEWQSYQTFLESQKVNKREVSTVQAEAEGPRLERAFHQSGFNVHAGYSSASTLNFDIKRQNTFSYASQNQSQVFNSEATSGGAAELGAEYFYRDPNSFGFSAGASYEFERQVTEITTSGDAQNGAPVNPLTGSNNLAQNVNPSYSLLFIEANANYSLGRQLYFLAGPNFSLPVTQTNWDQFLGRGVDLKPGVGFQGGVGYQISKEFGAVLLYRYSTIGIESKSQDNNQQQQFYYNGLNNQGIDIQDTATSQGFLVRGYYSF